MDRGTRNPGSITSTCVCTNLVREKVVSNSGRFSEERLFKFYLAQYFCSTFSFDSVVGVNNLVDNL